MVDSEQVIRDLERYPNKRQMEKILKFLGCHIEIQEDA